MAEEVQVNGGEGGSTDSQAQAPQEQPAQTLETNPQPQPDNRSQSRIKELSDKVELTAKERDELKTLREKDQQEIAALKQEKQFNEDFSQQLSLHPEAQAHKEEIFKKVQTGYSVEDATLATLAKAGELSSLGQQQQPQTGGSAPTHVTAEGAYKDIKDMTVEEKLNVLKEEERKGNLYLS